MGAHPGQARLGEWLRQQRIASGLTQEDLRNPQDFPALMDDPTFNYEDGQLAGLRSAHMAIRAEILRGKKVKGQK